MAKIELTADSRQVRKATDDLAKLEKQGIGNERSARKLGLAFGVVAVAAAALGAVLLSSTIKATIEQERVTAQLDQTLRSTGRYTPELSRSMQDYAASLQVATTYGDEAIIGAQSLLLTFTQIGGKTFPHATEAVLNVATAMGTDLKSAAIQVGKALNDPILGVTALARSGIQFTESQKDMIKEMVETNRVAEAQALILKELDVQFGGSARAARDTMGGALKALQNAFGDLLEGDAGGEGVKGATRAINALVERLSSPETQQAFANVANMMITLASKTADAIVLLNDLFTTSLEEQSNAAMKVVEDLESQFRNVRNPIAKMRIKEDLDEARQEAERLQLAIWGLGSKPTAALNVPALITSTASVSAGKEAAKQITIDSDEVFDAWRPRLFEDFPVAAEKAMLDSQQIFDSWAPRLFEDFPDEAEKQVEKTETVLSQFAVQAASNMQNAMADGFFDLFTGQLGSLRESFANTLQRMAADLAASSLLNFLVGDFGGSGGGALGGIIGDVVGSFGGFRANGGPVSTGSSYIVGERGPELFTPKTGGTITPNGGGGGVNVVVNVDAGGTNAQGDNEQSSQLGRLIGASVRSILIDERRPGGLLA